MGIVSARMHPLRVLASKGQARVLGHRERIHISSQEKTLAGLSAAQGGHDPARLVVQRYFEIEICEIIEDLRSSRRGEESELRFLVDAPAEIDQAWVEPLGIFQKSSQRSTSIGKNLRGEGNITWDYLGLPAVGHNYRFCTKSC